jgi:HlyD family secretion protein
MARLFQKGLVAEQEARALHNEEAQAAVVAASRRQVEAAQGSLTAAKAYLVNPAIRASQGAAVQGQILQARADIAAAEAEAERARAALEEARANRRDLQVIAPFAGTVATRTAEPGEVVTAGTPIVTLVNLARCTCGRSPEGQIGRASGPAGPRGLDSIRASPSTLGDTRRSAGLVHAGEHVLPRGPGEAGGGREAGLARRRRLREAGHAGRRRDSRRGRSVGHGAHGAGR